MPDLDNQTIINEFLVIIKNAVHSLFQSEKMLQRTGIITLTNQKQTKGSHAATRYQYDLHYNYIHAVVKSGPDTNRYTIHFMNGVYYKHHQSETNLDKIISYGRDVASALDDYVSGKASCDISKYA